MKDQNRTCEILMHEWKQKPFLIMEDPHRFIEEFISTKKAKRFITVPTQRYLI